MFEAKATEKEKSLREFSASKFSGGPTDVAGITIFRAGFYVTDCGHCRCLWLRETFQIAVPTLNPNSATFFRENWIPSPRNGKKKINNKKKMVYTHVLPQ